MQRLGSLVLSALCAVCCLSSCSPDEPFIDSFKDQWRLVTADRSGVQSHLLPQESSQPLTVWSDPSQEFPISSISAFRDALYLLHASRPWIVVLNSTTLVATDTIDLTGFGVAADISFANATTAYVSVPETQQVVVVDITVMKAVTGINVEGRPAGIAATGNQICVVLPEQDQAVIIDSRRNAVVERITTSRAPTYCEADDLNSVFCIAALGFGKIDDAAHTPPMMDFISATSRKLVKSLEISGRATNSTLQLPMGLAVTRSEFAFVPVQNGLVRVNTRTRSRTTLIQFESYSGITYNENRAEILVSRTANGTTICDALDEFGEALKLSASVLDSVSAISATGP